MYFELMKCVGLIQNVLCDLLLYILKCNHFGMKLVFVLLDAIYVNFPAECYLKYKLFKFTSKLLAFFVIGVRLMRWVA